LSSLVNPQNNINIHYQITEDLLTNQQIFVTKKKLLTAFKTIPNYTLINETYNKIQNLKTGLKVEIKQYFIYEANIYFLTEYYENGSLNKYLSEQLILTEHKAKIIIRQLRDFLKYCHHRCVKHCNLHPNNVLFVDNKFNKIKVSN